ncbi:MAG: ThiF family adenylyltransferase [Sphingomonadales bacterium]|jgi:molybdopterin/thiamine biosynthesis adenylyltransferase
MGVDERHISAFDRIKAPHQQLFDYDEAFSRNIGWITDWEQQILRSKRIAIAGMGGVGGIHLQTLARLGVSHFSIADLDNFELVNFNRQAVANMNTLGKPKVKMAAEMALSINPELDLRILEKGVTPENLDHFLDGVDLYVDSLDFFAFEIRRAVFTRCHEKGIPAVTAAPIGMGVGYIVFHPEFMSFEDYFQFGKSKPENLPVDFLLGLTPAMLHQPYLADGSRVDLENQKGPSVAMSCQLCAGVAGVEAVKLLLKRGPLKPAPYYHHFDSYRGKFVTRKLRFGNGGPFQSFKRYAASRLVGQLSKKARPEEPSLDVTAKPIDHILNTARWAPSGDNSQPWRFEILSDDQFYIHGDLEAGNVYQFARAEPNWLALGMLIEAMVIEAKNWGLGLDWKLVEYGSEKVQIFVTLTKQETVADPLSQWIKSRSVDRRGYYRTAIANDKKRALAQTLGAGLSVEWHEGFAAKRFFARVMSIGTAIRLRIAETYEVHRQVIDWSGPFSRTGLPAQATGLSLPLRLLMRWALQGYGRMRFLTQAMKGRWVAALDMDIIPAIQSAGFFIIRKTDGDFNAAEPEEKIRAGQLVYRFWLEATQQALALQPAIAPLCFARYAQDETQFSTDRVAVKWAGKLLFLMRGKLGRVDNIVFLGRIGTPRSFGCDTRSLRRSLDELVIGDLRANLDK